MSLSRSHTKTLKRDLAAHEERLRFLRNQITHFAEEAKMHENIITLGRDERLMKALDELSSDQRLAEELVRGPAAYARSHGVQLPDDAELNVSSQGGHTRASLRFRHGGWDYTCAWDSTDGFSVAAPDGHHESA